MTYLDGFVFTVPKKNLDAYKKMAQQGKNIWKKHGALDYKECIGDDLKIKGMLSFNTLTKAKANEIVCFSFITFKSKAHRNAVNKKVMADPDMNSGGWDKKMPFDPAKMAYGGFKTIVES